MTACGTPDVMHGTLPDRFPKLRYLLTEAGCAWVPQPLERLDTIWARVRTGAVGESQYNVESMPPEPPSFYARFTAGDSPQLCSLICSSVYSGSAPARRSPCRRAVRMPAMGGKE